MYFKSGRLFLASLFFVAFMAGCNLAADQEIDHQGALSVTANTLVPIESTSFSTSTLVLATPTRTASPRPAAITGASLTPKLTRTPGASPSATLFAAKLLLESTAQPQSLLLLDPIQIRSPGSGSQVLSPIPLEVQFSSGDAVEKIRIELRTADGKLLVRKLFNRDQLPAGERYSDMIEFETPVSPASAYLIVGLDDPIGKPLAVSTVPIDLLSSGLARLAPDEWQAKAIDIQLPTLQAEIAGGTVQVSGLTRLDPGSLLKVQVIDEATGKIVGQRLASIDSTGKGPFYPFIAQVPYQVHQRTNARLVVYRDLAPNGLILYLASQSVTLNP